MFLTGFLTGFAEQAKDEIAQRNKELRERMDEQFKEHKRKYEAEYALKKEERRVIGERSAVFQDLVKNYEGFDNITVGQQLAIIANQKEYEQFQQDLRDLDNAPEDIKAKRIEAIKRGMTGKTNIKYDNIDDAIEAYTQVQDIVRPTAITNKTAFGLKSNIQKDMLDTYKASMPDAFKKVQAKTLKTGGYKGTAATQKLTKADARTTVTTALQNKIDEFLKDPGGSGPKSTLLFLKPNVSQTYKDGFAAATKDKVSIVSDYQGARLTGLDALSSTYDTLIGAIKAQTALDLIEKTNVDGAISTELASSIESELGIDIFGNQIASGATDIYVTDQNKANLKSFLKAVDIGPSVGEKTQTIKSKLTGDKDPSDAGTKDFGNTGSANASAKQPDKKEVRALYDRMAAINAQFLAAQGNPRRQKSLKTQYMKLLEQLDNDYGMDPTQAQKYLGI